MIKNFCMYNSQKNKKKFLLFTCFILMTGFKNMIIMNSKGAIGLEEKKLILIALGLMLIIVIPVIFMTFFFSFKYRESNKKSEYLPYWCHSKYIETIIWTIPIIIISFIAFITWKSSFELEPNKPILSKYKEINIDVISLDWKWLFIYPEYKIATINKLVFPVDTPIKFKITSNSVMNSFFIPQLGTQTYAMAGMTSILYLIADVPGQYQGISSHFSGSGFSGMKFITVVTKNKSDFKKWINSVQKSKNHLTSSEHYEKISQPSVFHPVEYFSDININLFNNIIKKFSK